MAKYQTPFFCSPYSSISPPTTDFFAARSSSRDGSGVHHFQLPMYTTMSRTTSAQSTQSHPRSSPMRRSSSSSSQWSEAPYRTCLSPSVEQPNSYLSDDDLLCLDLPVEKIPEVKRSERHEISTEERIAQLRRQQEEEHHPQPSQRSSTTNSTKKAVHFEDRGPRRPSHLKRRSTAVRRGLSNLNGPA